MLPLMIKIHCANVSKMLSWNQEKAKIRLQYHKDVRGRLLQEEAEESGSKEWG